MSTTLTEAERDEVRTELRQLLKNHDTIKTLAEYRGMTAYVRLFIIKDNELLDITHQAGEAMGERTAHKVSQPYGLKYSGYGYSKEFEAVYSLGRALYPKGYKHTTRVACHSNDHSNGVHTDWHRDGGYKFYQRSI